MANFDFEIDGLEAFLDRIDNAVRDLPGAVGDELYQWGNEVMTVSKEERVPVDTGFLLNSGYVAPPEIEDNRVDVVLGYGADYALAVHEDMGKRHWKRPGSGPHYLQGPADEVQNQLPDRVAARVHDTIAA